MMPRVSAIQPPLYNACSTQSISKPNTFTFANSRILSLCLLIHKCRSHLPAKENIRHPNSYQRTSWQGKKNPTSYRLKTEKKSHFSKYRVSSRYGRSFWFSNKAGSTQLSDRIWQAPSQPKGGNWWSCNVILHQRRLKLARLLTAPGVYKGVRSLAILQQDRFIDRGWLWGWGCARGSDGGGGGGGGCRYLVLLQLDNNYIYVAFLKCVVTSSTYVLLRTSFSESYVFFIFYLLFSPGVSSFHTLNGTGNHH